MSACSRAQVSIIGLTDVALTGTRPHHQRIHRDAPPRSSTVTSSLLAGRGRGDVTVSTLLQASGPKHMPPPFCVYGWSRLSGPLTKPRWFVARLPLDVGVDAHRRKRWQSPARTPITRPSRAVHSAVHSPVGPSQIRGPRPPAGGYSRRLRTPTVVTAGTCAVFSTWRSSGILVFVGAIL